jgi:hypothetical protein
MQENDGVQAWECVLSYDVIKNPVVDECGCVYEQDLINQVFKRAADARAAAEKRKADQQFALPGDDRLLRYAHGEIPCPRTTKLIHANVLIKSQQVRELCEHITKPQPTPHSQPSIPATTSASDKTEAMFACILEQNKQLMKKMISVEHRVGSLESVIAVQQKQLNNAFNISGCEMVRLLLPTSICSIPTGGITMKDVTDKNLSERDLTVLYHYEVNSSYAAGEETFTVTSKEDSTSNPKIAEKAKTGHHMQQGYGLGMSDIKENVLANDKKETQAKGSA